MDCCRCAMHRCAAAVRPQAALPECDVSPAETDRYTCKWLLLYSCGLSLVCLLGRLASYKTSEFERAPTGICVHGDSPDCNLKLPAVRRQLERNPQCSTSDPGPSPAAAFARNLGGPRLGGTRPREQPGRRGASGSRAPGPARGCGRRRRRPRPQRRAGTMPARAAGPAAAGGIHHDHDAQGRGGGRGAAWHWQLDGRPGSGPGLVAGPPGWPMYCGRS